MTDRWDHWSLKAACRGMDCNVFFYEIGVKEAKEVCESCSVKLQCLKDYKNEPFGVFGGLTAEERGYSKGFKR